MAKDQNLQLFLIGIVAVVAVVAIVVMVNQGKQSVDYSDEEPVLEEEPRDLAGEATRSVIKDPIPRPSSK